MEQAQLYKRLVALTMAELEALIPLEEALAETLYKLDLAAKTRRTIEHIQFDDMWQGQVDETGPFEVYVEFRLSQHLLESCTSIRGDQNELTWRLVLPTADKIPGPAGARTFQSYLDVALRVEIVNIDKHDILALCTALDIGYDFYSIDGSAPYRGP